MEQVHFEQFETEIRYHFKNRHFLVEALSHSSYANEKKKCRCSNERLEFLGDSVLSIVVSSYLFHQFPELPEGELTKLRASLVCEKALHVFAQEIHLGDYLLLGKGEEHTGGRMRSSILADAFEAVIAAIYLDGGMEAVTKYIMGFMEERIESTKSNFRNLDCKTHLQEVIQQAVQARGMQKALRLMVELLKNNAKNPEEKVEYVLVSESGPDHAKAFQVEVCLNSNVIGVGTGRSKKAAEQMAAKEALRLMGYEK